MNKFEELQKQLADLLDNNATKEQIEKVAVINNTVKELAEESSKQNEEYKGLLKDYAKVVKTSAFSTDKTKADEGNKEPITFDKFFDNYKIN